MKSPEAYDLDRKAQNDQDRHIKKVEEAIRKNLKDIIGEEEVITKDGDKIVRVPIRGLDLPDFRYGRNEKRVGQGTGDSQEGDVIGRDPSQQGPGKGKQAGEEPGVDVYDVEISIDELAEMVFEGMELPFVLPKGGKMIKTMETTYDDISMHGLMPNWAKMPTMKAHLLRKAKKRLPIKVGGKGPDGFHTDDLRFKVWDEKIRPVSQAVFVNMRDVSGSMGNFEKFITRSYFHWMLRFLRSKYDEVETVFLTHHTEAKEVDENAFFNLSESGGTKISTVLKLADEIIAERYDPKQWNIYPFYFSDGDNWGDVDNNLCVELVLKILGPSIEDPRSNLFGYGEIQEGGRRSSGTLMTAFKKIKNPRFVAVELHEKADIYKALHEFFKPDRKLSLEGIT